MDHLDKINKVALCEFSLGITGCNWENQFYWSIPFTYDRNPAVSLDITCFTKIVLQGTCVSASAQTGTGQYHIFTESAPRPIQSTIRNVRLYVCMSPYVYSVKVILGSNVLRWSFRSQNRLRQEYIGGSKSQRTSQLHDCFKSSSYFAVMKKVDFAYVIFFRANERLKKYSQFAFFYY